MNRIRRFHSYEDVNPKIHYCVPRTELIDRAYDNLVGNEIDERGHYITVWGPRQSGKSWLMRQTLRRLLEQDGFEVGMLALQSARNVETEANMLSLFVHELRTWFKRDFPEINRWEEIRGLFTKPYFSKPVILIMDEFDALGETWINKFANEFRQIHISRRNEVGVASGEKKYLLHGLALIGVRSVLGIENVSGSPFNVQRSLPIPNLTRAEVNLMFADYRQESGQVVEQAVVDRVFDVTQGQPGLVGWLGEQLTEPPFNPDYSQPIDMPFFEQVYGAALYVLPNNNVLNLISKARQAPYRSVVLDLFRTDKKMPFSYDDPLLNYLYMNGVINWEQSAPERYYAKFPSPFVQRRLFNAFARDIFPETGQLYPPLTDLSHVITENSLNVKNLLRVYETYFQANRHWLLEGAPRRRDLRVYEAVYHFNLYSYLQRFFENWPGRVQPEFPTGNGQIDLIITYAGQTYGIEVKTFTDDGSYRSGLAQSIRYATRLGLQEVVMVSFIEAVPDDIRQKYEAPHTDPQTGIVVQPVIVCTD